MTRVPPVLVGLLLTACGTTTATESATRPPDAAAATVIDDGGAEASTRIDPTISKAATSAKGVTKIKLRLDASGNLVKQAVYHGDEGRISAQVRELAVAKFPGGTAEYYESEFYAEHGEVHEVEVKTADGKHCEVAAKPDGTELYVECHIAESELPPAVSNTVAATIPGGKILEAEKKTSKAGDTFTVEIESGGTEYYLILSASGELQHKLRRIPAIVEVPVP